MSFQAKVVQAGQVVDYTPVGAVVAGAVVVIGTELVGVVRRDIAAGALGSAQVGGVADIVKTSNALTAGDKAYWDATGNPYGGTPGSGAISPNKGVLCGRVLEGAAGTAATARVLLIPSTADNIIES